MTAFVRCLLLPLLLALALTSCATLERGRAVDAELERIRALLPGTYTGPSPSPWDPSVTLTLQHVFAEIDAPQLGELVYYYQLSLDGKVMQQKLFTFDTSAARTRNAMQPSLLPPRAFPGDLHTRPELWATLQPNKLGSFPPECALRWSAGTATDAWPYSARSLPRDCRFESVSFGGIIKGYIRYDVGTETLRWQERLVAESGELVAETAQPLTAERVTNP